VRAAWHCWQTRTLGRFTSEVSWLDATLAWQLTHVTMRCALWLKLACGSQRVVMREGATVGSAFPPEKFSVWHSAHVLRHSKSSAAATCSATH